MTDSQKVFIRGVAGRGDEVIKMLEDRGENRLHLDGSCQGRLYFINHNGCIVSTLIAAEMAKIIMDNYQELHLPDMWKDGDAEKKAGCGFEWKPNMGEVYFYLGSDLFVGKTSNDGLELDEGHFHCGNCFRTRKEAEAAAERVKKALKGGEK